MVRNGKLKLDRYQRQIIEHLQRLHSDMVNYEPSSAGFFNKVGSDSKWLILELDFNVKLVYMYLPLLILSLVSQKTNCLNILYYINTFNASTVLNVINPS